MKSETRKITEGALMVALVGIMLIANRYSGQTIEVYFSFALTIPLILFTAKYGIKETIVPFVACIIMTLIIAVPTTLFFVINGSFAGMAYGWGVSKRKENGILLAITVFFSLISNFVMTYLLAELLGLSVTRDIEILIEMFANLDITTVGTYPIAVYIKMIYPAAVFMTALTEGVLVHMVSNLLLRRLKYPVNRFERLDEIKIPKWIGYTLLLLCALPFIFSLVKVHQVITDICYTCFIVSLMFFAIYGLIIIGWLIRQTGRRVYVFAFYISFFIFFKYFVFFAVFIGSLAMCTDLKEKIKGKDLNAGKD